MIRLKYVSQIILILWVMTACISSPEKRTAQNSLQAPPMNDHVMPFQYDVPKPEDGAIWSESSQNLFVDRRARSIGDLITVRISENPKAKLHAKTDTKHDSSITANADFLGYIEALKQKNKNLGVPSNLINTSFKPSFVGEGTNDRDGNMTAYITAVVTRLLPNGNLYITGQREIQVNNETQFIKISGFVRPEDIDLNNEVQSAYIGDARIEYSGKGVIAEHQRPGWMMRLLSNTWPF